MTFLLIDIRSRVVWSFEKLETLKLEAATSSATIVKKRDTLKVNKFLSFFFYIKFLIFNHIFFIDKLLNL